VLRINSLLVLVLVLACQVLVLVLVLVVYLLVEYLIQDCLTANKVSMMICLGLTLPTSVPSCGCQVIWFSESIDEIIILFVQYM